MQFKSYYIIHFFSLQLQLLHSRSKEHHKAVKEVMIMTYKLSKFTIRIDAVLLKKFRYIAEYNARSANREFEMLIKRHIAEFEKANGKITLD